MAIRDQAISVLTNRIGLRDQTISNLTTQVSVCFFPHSFLDVTALCSLPLYKMHTQALCTISKSPCENAMNCAPCISNYWQDLRLAVITFLLLLLVSTIMVFCI